MALQVQSSKGALDAPIQGFLVTKTTSRAINYEVWDWPRDQNHIVASVDSARSNPTPNLGRQLQKGAHSQSAKT